jgi:hypothetical protein
MPRRAQPQLLQRLVLTFFYQLISSSLLSLSLSLSHSDFKNSISNQFPSSILPLERHLHDSSMPRCLYTTHACLYNLHSYLFIFLSFFLLLVLLSRVVRCVIPPNSMKLGSVSSRFVMFRGFFFFFFFNDKRMDIVCIFNGQSFALTCERIKIRRHVHVIIELK